MIGRLLGFEPRTSWSVVKRSIQLSYKRIIEAFIILYLLKFFHDINRYHNFKKRMYLNSKINFLKSNFFNFLIGLIPISFIAGNMIINIILLLIIISTIIIFNKKFFKIKFYLMNKIIISFFILIIATGLIINFFIKWFFLAS